MPTTFNRLAALAVVGLVAAVLAPAVIAQTATVQVTRQTVIMETPRGDSTVLATVPSGATLEVFDHRGEWYGVRAWKSDDTSGQRGWIHRGFVKQVSGGSATAARKRGGELLIRGFGQAGLSYFTARNSFETVLGSAFGSTLGGGAQLAFPNGAFAQVSVDRFKETGSLALVSGTQVFRLETPVEIYAKPVQFTAGYREVRSYRAVPYVGGGIGWYSFHEESRSFQESENAEQRQIGFHALGGVEYVVGRWLSVAGEVNWSKVPNVLGRTGVSAAFAEDDRGDTTFKFKLIVGR